MKKPELLHRHAKEYVGRLLDTFPVVAVTGPRQVGKSTLAGQIVADKGGVYATLDDAATLAQSLDDPQGFVTQTDGLLVVDEIQRAPGLLVAIKLAVDRDRRPGRFIITGSANLLRMKSVTESLAGRSAWLELAPLMWSEIVGRPGAPSIDAAFHGLSAGEYVSGFDPAPAGLTEDAYARAIAGGMPATLGLSHADRRIWYDSYRQTFLERDLRQLSQIENLPEFGRLMSLALVRSGSVVSRQSLATDAGLSYQTLRRYLNILEVGYQLHELPPYFANVGKRLVKSPKLYAADCGLAAYASNIASWDDAIAQGRDGLLMETWFVNEVRALNSLSETKASLHFWRTAAGAEVDLVLESGQDVVAIEVKASATVSGRDLRGLRSLRDDLGKRFRLGIVAYLGRETQALDKSLCVVPIPALLGVA